MKSRIAIPFILLAAIGLGVWWFLANFERVPGKEKVGPSGEARLNPFLAAERFAGRMGVRAAQVRTLYPDCVGIFILPPSLEELERRLRARGQDSHVVIQRRLANAQAEMAHAGEFDYRIINKDFDTAKAELAQIVRRERRAR